MHSAGLGDLFRLWWGSWLAILLTAAIAGAGTYGLSLMLPNEYSARVTLLPPQQQSSAANAALASLSALGSLAGLSAGLRTPADQYVALLESATLRLRLIDEFKLRESYGWKYREEALRKFGRRVRVTVGRRDGIISIEVDDVEPERAAQIANRHVDELRSISSQLSLTEAQQRRSFFEAQLRLTRERLERAQTQLQASGFDSGTLRAEPRAAAEGYARLRAELTGAEVRLATMLRSRTEQAPEVQVQMSAVSALRAQLSRFENRDTAGKSSEYLSLYREFKYQEALFELFGRQYELARLDEARDGAFIQVIDSALPPERKSGPPRLLLAVGGAIVGLLAASAWTVFATSLRRKRDQKADPTSST